MFRYAKKAFERLNLEVPADEELDNSGIDEMLGQWNKVIVMFSLGMMIGPVVESVILLDRMLYLAENGNVVLEFLVAKESLLNIKCCCRYLQ